MPLSKWIRLYLYNTSLVSERTFYIVLHTTLYTLTTFRKLRIYFSGVHRKKTSPFETSWVYIVWCVVFKTIKKFPIFGCVTSWSSVMKLCGILIVYCIEYFSECIFTTITLKPFIKLGFSATRYGDNILNKINGRVYEMSFASRFECSVAAMPLSLLSLWRWRHVCVTAWPFYILLLL